jgi:glutamate-5-semialdehyde dehydrogenase
MSAPSAETIAKTAKAAFEAAQLIPSSERNCALHAIKAALESVKSEILAANKVDLNVCTTYPLDRISTANQPWCGTCV